MKYQYKIEEEGFPNCLLYNENKIYVGDSKGYLKIFSIEYIYNKLKLIEQEKILVEKNVIINEIKFM